MKLALRIVTAAAIAAGLYFLIRHLLDDGQSSERRRNQSSPSSSPEQTVHTDGSGDLDGRTREQLYEEAKRLGIEGRSKMNKAELARAVQEARGNQS